MVSVFIRALSFTLIILLGIVLKSTGFLPENAGDTVKKIMINITLPTVVVTNFSSIESIGVKMLLVAVIGALTNIIGIAVGLILTRKRSKEEQVLMLYCLPGYNIGAFCLPFIQSFLPAMGTVTSCIFDVGNCVMCTGITYAFVSEYTSPGKEGGKGLDLLSFVKRLLSSPPLVAYIVMFLLAVLEISLPEVILTLIDPLAKANTFLAMLMLGLLFHLDFRREYVTKALQIVGIRNLFAAVFALICFFLLPFDLVVRQTLVLVCFAPMSAVAPAYTGMNGGDDGLASFTNGLTILCSLVTITSLLFILGIF